MVDVTRAEHRIFFIILAHSEVTRIHVPILYKAKGEGGKGERGKGERGNIGT